MPLFTCRQKNWLFRLLLLMGLWSAPIRASAEEEQDLAQAKQLFLQGEKAYRLGSFREALVNYQASYKLSSRPALLFNMAQCHRQLQETDKAIFYYRLYISDWERQQPGVEVPYRAEVESIIARLTHAPERTSLAQRPV